jgi:DNA mismatch repair protein MSH6
MLVQKRTPNVTPVPSSDAIEPSSSQENRDTSAVKVTGMDYPSPTTPANIP